MNYKLYFNTKRETTLIWVLYKTTRMLNQSLSRLACVEVHKPKCVTSPHQWDTKNHSLPMMSLQESWHWEGEPQLIPSSLRYLHINSQNSLTLNSVWRLCMLFHSYWIPSLSLGSVIEASSFFWFTKRDLVCLHFGFTVGSVTTELL